MRAGVSRGLLRCAVAISLPVALCVAFVFAEATLREFFRWLDFLSAAPGLSGLAILALFPVATALLFFGANWVYTGFAGQPEEQPEAKPPQPS